MDYIELIKELFGPKPAPRFTHPTLTYGPNGWAFGSSHFGNEEQAKKARAAYWGNDSGVHSDDFPTPQEPLTLDSDLLPD